MSASPHPPCPILLPTFSPHFPCRLSPTSATNRRQHFPEFRSLNKTLGKWLGLGARQQGALRFSAVYSARCATRCARGARRRCRRAPTRRGAFLQEMSSVRLRLAAASARCALPPHVQHDATARAPEKDHLPEDPTKKGVK